MTHEWRDFLGGAPMDFQGTRISASAESIRIDVSRPMAVGFGELETRRMDLRIARENLPALAHTLAARLAIDGFPDLAIEGCGDRVLVSAEPIDETREFTIANRRREQPQELCLTEGMAHGLMQMLADRAWDDRGNAHRASEVTLEEPITESYVVDRSEPDYLYIRHTRANASGSRWEGRLVMRRSNLPWLVAQLLVASLSGAQNCPRVRWQADGDTLEIYEYARLVCVMNSRPWKWGAANPPYDGRYLLMMTRETAERLREELAEL